MARWRYVSKDQSGNEFAFHGVYHEVLAPQRIIDTFEFEGLPGSRTRVPRNTHLRRHCPEEEPGSPLNRFSSRSPTAMAALQSGMEEGVNDSYERLAELLETMSQ